MRIPIIVIGLILSLTITSCSSSAPSTSNTNSTNLQSDKIKKLNINSGLLLGLSTNEKESNYRFSSYRTLWIAPQDGSIKVTEAPKIFVPYGEDWWMIENKQYKDEKKPENAMKSNDKNTVVINDLISHPFDESYSVNESLNKYAQKLLPYYRAVEENRKLVFVGNKYVSIVSDFYYNTGGTLRPYFKDAYVAEINAINRKFEYVNQENNLIPSSSDMKDLKKVSMTNMIGDQVSSLIQKYKDAKIDEKEQDLYGSSPTIENATNEYGWSIIRKNGGWIPQIAKRWIFSNGSTFSDSLTLFDMPLDLPQSVTSYDDLYPDWNSIKKSIPEAIDAVSSPTKDMLVVLTSDNLLVFTNPSVGLLKPDLTIKVNNENVIMSQWATGQYIAKWNSKLSTLMKND